MRDKGDVGFAGLDLATDLLAVPVAYEGRDGEILRDWGAVSTAPNSVGKLLKKLAVRFWRVKDYDETGPTGIVFAGS